MFPFGPLLCIEQKFAGRYRHKDMAVLASVGIYLYQECMYQDVIILKREVIMGSSRDDPDDKVFRRVMVLTISICTILLLLVAIPVATQVGWLISILGSIGSSLLEFGNAIQRKMDSSCKAMFASIYYN